MTSDKLIDAILNKCDVYYGESLISKEAILQRYLEFFAESLVAKEHSVNFALHTGSICFDIISVVAVSLGCLSYNLTTNEDVISSLRIDDMVMYSGQRYRWKGIKKEFGKQCMVLEQDGKGRNGASISYLPMEKYKHLIKPYYGESKVTDGRGVRKSNNNREEFLSYAFDVSENDVPTEIDVSIVIVGDRERFLEISKEVTLRYSDQKQIRLLDIVPASYYTSSGEEHQLGGNPTKAEPVLKVTGNMSAARDLILDKDGNKVVGLLVIGGISSIENCPELSDILRRNVLRFAHVTSPLKFDAGEHILEMYEGASVFACTKEFLEKYSHKVRSKNLLTEELHRQVENIVKNTVKPCEIEGGWSWRENCRLRNLLIQIRQSNLQEEQKEDFVITAYGLMNLLTTAIFPMKEMEAAIDHGKINPNVISPRKRLDTLWDIADKAKALQENFITIVDALETKFREFWDTTPKAERLDEFLRDHKECKIAVIVTKAYYANLLAIIHPEYFSNEKIVFVTPNRFDRHQEYDYVVTVGNITNNRFDPLQCLATRHVELLLYNCEKKLFSHLKIKKKKLETKLNQSTGLRKIPGGSNTLDSDDLLDTSDDDGDLEQAIREFSELDEYITSANIFDVHKLSSYSGSNGGSSTVAEVTHIGSFTSGEQIFFSRYYSAVVFDIDTETVIEKKVEDLCPGDVLVFLRRDDYTKNIVDFIYEKLIRTGRLGSESVDNYEKSQYWKEALREYKERENLSYRMVAKKLRALGSSLREVSIRQWMIEDSHIVGPRNEKTFGYIAQLTQDPYLLADVHGYFEACGMVRHERRTILSLIAKAINEKLRGHLPTEGSALEVVYENVDNLSETLELAYISRLDASENVSINLVNKPITETEVLM